MQLNINLAMMYAKKSAKLMLIHIRKIRMPLPYISICIQNTFSTPIKIIYVVHYS